MDDLSKSKIAFEDEFSYLEEICSLLGPSIVGVLDKCYVLDISKKLIEGVSYIQS